MNVLKKLTLHLGRGLMSSFLLLLPTTFLLTFTFSQPLEVKKLVHESGVYPLLTQAIVTTATSSFAANGQTYGLSRQAIKAAAEKAFPVGDIQQKGDRIMTETYDWLDGRSQSFQPTFDTTSNQKAFTQALTSEATTSITAKPACNDQQLLTLSLQDSNSLLQAPCRPAQLDENYLSTIFGAQFNNAASGQLGQTTDSGLINLAPTAQSSAPPAPTRTAASHGPQLAFAILKNSFYIALGAIVLGIIGVVSLTRKLLPSLRIIMRSFGLVGITLLVYAGLLLWLLNQQVASQLISGTAGQALQAIIRPFALVYIHANFSFGLGCVTIAVILFAIYRMYKSRHVTVVPAPILPDQPAMPAELQDPNKTA